MKVCQIVSSFPPISWGGTETHNYTLVKYLLDKGYDVEVVVTGQDADKKEEKYERIRIHYFKPTPLLWYKQLSSKVRNLGEFDVIDVHRSHLTIPFVRWKTPLILSLHFFEMTCPIPIKSNISGKGWPRPCEYGYLKCMRCIGFRRYARWKINRKIAISRSDSIMVKYNALKEIMIRGGIPEDKIDVVPHWIDVEKINKNSRTKKKSSSNNILFFGRMDYEKGPDILLKSFPEILKRNPKSNLTFVGGGPMLNDLKKTAKRFGKEVFNKITFLGHLPHVEIPKKIGSADLIVFPHRFFNYEWGLLEAMCSEKPIVATDVFATRDILSDDENAIICGTDTSDIADAVDKVFSNKKLLKEIAKNALKTIRKKHSMKNLIYYEELLTRLTG